MHRDLPYPGVPRRIVQFAYKQRSCQFCTMPAGGPQKYPGAPAQNRSRKTQIILDPPQNTRQIRRFISYRRSRLPSP